ncbi:MAG: hypothetical protein ACE15C_03280 [Phycisphaerae bacterium]
MRWIPFVILAYVIILIQTSAGRLMRIDTGWLGPIGPDFAGVVAAFVALRARGGLDAMLAAWALGLGIDLTTAGGVGFSTVIGPMPIAYALAAGMLYRVREAFFREHALAQGLLTMVFVFVAHGLWLTMQTLRLGGDWAAWRQMLLAALLVAVYSALLAPLIHALLGWRQAWFIAEPTGRGR